MKKVWLFATAVLALGTSCSKDNVGEIDDSTQQEIVLGTGSAVNVSQKASRGIGAIGGLEADNKWNGETVYVYGINTSAEGDAKFAINAETANAPTGSASGSLTWATEGTHYYYNGNDIYDFYGVHVDDAVAEASLMKIASGTDLAKTGFAVDATIDGTQDLMVAVPNKTADIEAAANPELTGKETSLYSAWSSRRKVKPNLVFNHLLSRLNFQAKCGDELPSEEPEIKITKIEILDVFSNGKLNVIPVSGGSQTFEPTAKDPDSPVNFTVKSKGTGNMLEELKPVAITTNELAPVGEDLLLYPEKMYTVKIYTEQDKDGDGQATGQEKATITKEIKLGEEKPFEAGFMYDINITVRGLQDIVVDATLTPWKDGGDIEIDPDDIPNPQPQP